MDKPNVIFVVKFLNMIFTKMKWVYRITKTRTLQFGLVGVVEYAEFASSGDESDSDENCRSVKPSEGTTRADADVCILMEEWR